MKNKYKSLKRKLLKSINTNDLGQKEKIYKLLCYWLEKEISKGNDKKYIKEKIDQMSKMNDLGKIKEVYYDKELDNLKNYSEEVFNMTISFIEYKNNGINQEEYDKYMLELKLFRFKINELFEEEVDFIYSECALDLYYLLNKGNSKVYSIRLSNYIKNGYNVFK